MTEKMADQLERYSNQQIPSSKLVIRGENGRIYINFQTFAEDIVIAMARDQVGDLVRLLENAVDKSNRP